MASVTGQRPSQPEMHENRAEYVTGRLYLVGGAGRGTRVEMRLGDTAKPRPRTRWRSRLGHRPEWSGISPVRRASEKSSPRYGRLGQSVNSSSLARERA